MKFIKYLAYVPYALMIITIYCICVCIPLSVYAKQASVQKALAKLEVGYGGRIGVYAVNTANNMRIRYKSQQRFPMCSTAKLMVVAAILKNSMFQKNLLNRQVSYTKEELISSGYAPITSKHLAAGMTIIDLCAAAIKQSDNAAANLLLKKLGGPKAVTSFAHSIGDTSFRLDRWEPKLNSAIPGDLRDTSTPEAMMKSLQKLIFGNILAPYQRRLLKSWLKHNTTGNSRIRAGIPKNWIVGDKTGTGGYGTTNDIGIIWPLQCKPIIMAIYFTQKEKNSAPNDHVIALATSILIKAFKHSDQCLKQ